MLVKLKTETRTLKQIEEILSVNPEADALIKKTFIDAVDKLYKEIFEEPKKDVSFLEVTDTDFDVKIKAEHKIFMRDLLGHSGPYKVTKKYQSWVGLSEGVYKIEGSDRFIPISWCQPVQDLEEKPKSSSLLTLLLVICSLAQSGALLLLLL